jgi:hypothetical protein
MFNLLSILKKYISYFQTKASIKKLIEKLIEFLSHNDLNIALDACICIGKLGVKDCESAVKSLINLYIKFSDWNKKALVLETLVKLFDCTSNAVFDFIMNQIQVSPYWSARLSAIKLLSYMGTKKH